MFVLGIESTCDETAASVVKDGKLILSNVIFSQAEKHAAFGGVFPELASRAHIEAIVPVIKLAIQEAGLEKQDIDLIAVAKEPGLVGGLLIGVESAKALSLSLNIPYVGINHVEAHLYAAMMDQSAPQFPALGVVLSGGHTLLVKINKLLDYEIIGTTIDDALGEAFDKLAVMLGYSYPGGAKIEELAENGDPHRFILKAGFMKDRPFDFSYSGLKTACRTLIEKQDSSTAQFAQDLAASFQFSVFKDLAKKIDQVTKMFGLNQVYLGGGVVCNDKLKETLIKHLPHLQFNFAPKGLCVDNAAMIAGLGFQKYQALKKGDALDITPKTRVDRF
jgi:N6-L-threonylcarbamoyladenine synthase